eukprot:GHVT01055075.1.p1 GENE.GHVT01055075.1~~GHVT01055075.1.p1  ORF type:complete len:324 (-),score=77.25 GHVT01055075.1:748-1695(-)
MVREVKIRERLRHGNIVEYKHSWLEMHRANEMCPYVPWLFVLMEYCNGGTLEELIWDRGPDCPPSRLLSDGEIWKLFFDMLSGLKHLHHGGILYRDLKTANVLLNVTSDTITEQLTCSALLSDFGTAEFFSERARTKNHGGFSGTVEYTAPELLAVQEAQPYCGDFAVKSDMWSLGIILYAAAYGRLPYAADSPQQTANLIRAHQQAPIPDTPPRPAAMVYIIRALTDRRPACRPSTDDLLTHRAVRKLLGDTHTFQQANLMLAEKIRILTDAKQHRHQQQQQEQEGEHATAAAVARRRRASVRQKKNEIAPPIP